MQVQEETVMSKMEVKRPEIKVFKNPTIGDIRMVIINEEPIRYGLPFGFPISIIA